MAIVRARYFCISTQRRSPFHAQCNNRSYSPVRLTHFSGTSDKTCRFVVRRLPPSSAVCPLLLDYCAFRSLYFVLLSQQRAPRYRFVAWRFRSSGCSPHGYRSHFWTVQEERKPLEWCHGLTVFFPFTTDTPAGKCFHSPRTRLLAAGRCAARRL